MSETGLKERLFEANSEAVAGAARRDPQQGLITLSKKRKLESAKWLGSGKAVPVTAIP
jgi:hypothetical protein